MQMKYAEQLLFILFFALESMDEDEEMCVLWMMLWAVVYETTGAGLTPPWGRARVALQRHLVGVAASPWRAILAAHDDHAMLPLVRLDFDCFDHLCQLFTPFYRALTSVRYGFFSSVFCVYISFCHCLLR